MKYQNIREEELKNKIAQDYFWLYDCSKIIGNVDFCVCMHQHQKEIFETESLLWAEAKKGSADAYNSITQLILTIGKARTFDKFLPPPFLGAFDGEKIAFIPYNEIHDIFYLNDFNWTVTPSNYNTKEFKLIYEKVKNVIDAKALLFNYTTHESELKRFIKNNFIAGKFGLTKTRIDKNNFINIYNKWLQAVKPSIALKWDILKTKNNIIDGDFYLADLLSKDNLSLKDKLFVYLTNDHYELERIVDDLGMFRMKQAFFNDKQLAHTQFWNKYERPPKEEYWDYIVERRDLLVPQDVRERKGSFFTPQIWVELSQKYLSDVLGENWQDEYYVWDCAAGTGNLLTGLTNKYNIWASTLDKQDVEVMHDRIINGANLLHDHVFQFDFLNDDFTKLPQPLQNIINDENKRKKLIIYINPPYAEAGDTKQRIGYGKNKENVSNQTHIHKKYSALIKDYAKRELYIQFFARIYEEIPNCKLAQFSTLKLLQAPYFADFRKYFLAELKTMFVVPANSFDNVKGKFPIGFFIWDTNKKNEFAEIKADVYNIDGSFENKKSFFSYDNTKNINDWLRPTWKNNDERLAYLTCNSNDFQNSIGVFIQSNKSNQTSTYYKPITSLNLIQSSIYYAVRHCIEATWLNDRDQFLYPNDGWITDNEFRTNCLTYTLFSNNIQSKFGTNYWIPFTEQEVNAREKFDSNFITDYIKGKPKPPQKSTYILNILFEPEVPYNRMPLQFSTTAKEVFNAGRELWKYYHQQPNCNVNASLYDIREHFQGRNDKGKMNNKSLNETYTNLISNLRDKLKQLAAKIEPKIYEYGFLKE
ncbi:MAG: hypothetical protein JST94_07490 [Bacteroidetes bacterium]|nr:hypothetical protein [Bacteroidota bacterium]MBS1671280.1 hypothetical protein [Bacteroidota bacterium]